MDVSGPFLRTDHDGRLPGRIDGFYIMRLTIVEKVPIFSITFIKVLSIPWDLRVGVISRSVVLGAPAGRSKKLSLISF